MFLTVKDVACLAFLPWVKTDCVWDDKAPESACVSLCVRGLVRIEGGDGVWLHTDGSQANLSIRPGV